MKQKFNPLRLIGVGRMATLRTNVRPPPRIAEHAFYEWRDGLISHVGVEAWSFIVETMLAKAWEMAIDRDRRRPESDQKAYQGDFGAGLRHTTYPLQDAIVVAFHCMRKGCSFQRLARELDKSENVVRHMVRDVVSVLVNALSPFVYVRSLEEEKAMNPTSYLDQKPQLVMALDHTPTKIRLPRAANSRAYFYYRKPNGGAHVKTACLISPDRWIGWIGSESVPAGVYNDTGALQRRPVPYDERSVEMQQLAVVPQRSSAPSELQCMVAAVKEAGCDSRVYADGGYTFKREELAASEADHYLVTPVRKPSGRDLTQEQVKFNEHLQAIRSPIEKVFGGLKAAWAVLGAYAGSDAQLLNDMFMVIAATSNIHLLATKTARLSNQEFDHMAFDSGDLYFRISPPADDLPNASDASAQTSFTPEFVRQLPEDDILTLMYKAKAVKGPLTQRTPPPQLRTGLSEAGRGHIGRSKQFVETNTAQKRKEEAAKEEQTALRLARRMLKRAKWEQGAPQSKRRASSASESRQINGIAAGAEAPPPRSRAPPQHLKDYSLEDDE